MAETKTLDNCLVRRYPPNSRFLKGVFKEQVVVPVRYDNFGESVTDKESYRLSLASKRGSIGNGTNNTGWYMFNDGKYDHDKDFSFFYRKDLSVVEIDNYINDMKKNLENADSNLKKEIELQIQKAESKKQEIQTGEDEKESQTE